MSLVAVSGDGSASPSDGTTQVDFEPAVLLWDGVLLWAAGSDTDATSTTTTGRRRHGGGFVALDPADGRVVVRGRFDDDLAWGNGGVAVVVVPGALCGFGRRGEIHVFDTRHGGARRDDASGRRRVARASRTRAALGDHLVFGFNRGGYRLWRVPVASVQRAVLSR